MPRSVSQRSKEPSQGGLHRHDGELVGIVAADDEPRRDPGQASNARPLGPCHLVDRPVRQPAPKDRVAVFGQHAEQFVPFVRPGIEPGLGQSADEPAVVLAAVPGVLAAMFWLVVAIVLVVLAVPARRVVVLGMLVVVAVDVIGHGAMSTRSFACSDPASLRPRESRQHLLRKK
jgi:hypothetical protein